MHFATWDVGDLDSHNIYQRRTGLIAQEFAKYNLDIVAVSATQTVARDYPIEEVGGYTFFWNGRGGERRHIVGFALKDALAHKLKENPIPISEDILTMRLPLKKKRFAVFVSAHGPAPDDGYRAKVEFYNILDRFLSAVPQLDKLFLMGNFNATVGKCEPQWEGVIGKHGHGIANCTGYSLLQLCVEHNLIITNTLQEQREQNKTTWLNPYALDWLLVDYMIVRRKDHFDVVYTRAICEIDFVWSYHRLVKSMIALPINLKFGNPPFIRRKNVKKTKPQSTPNTSENIKQGKGKEQQKSNDLLKSPKKQDSSTVPKSSGGTSQDKNKKQQEKTGSSECSQDKNKKQQEKTGSTECSQDKNKKQQEKTGSSECSQDDSNQKASQKQKKGGKQVTASNSQN